MGTTKTKKTTKAPAISTASKVNALVRKIHGQIQDLWVAFQNTEARLREQILKLDRYVGRTHDHLTKLTAQQDGDRAELQRLIRLTEQHGRLFESGRASDNATVASLRRELTTVATRCATIESGLGGAQWKAQGQPARWITLLSTKHLENIIVGGWGKATEGPTRRAIESELVRRRQDATYRAAEQKVSPAETPRAVVEPNTFEVEIDGVLHTNPKQIVLRPDGKGNMSNPDLIVLEPKKLATGGVVSSKPWWDLADERDFGAAVHSYWPEPDVVKPPEFAPPKESILEEVARRRKAGEKCELRFGPDGRLTIVNLETPQEEYARRTKAGEDVRMLWNPSMGGFFVEKVQPLVNAEIAKLSKDLAIMKKDLEIANARLENHRLELDTAAKTSERVDRLERIGDNDHMQISNTLNRVRYLESKLPPVGAIPTKADLSTVQVDFATLGWRGRFCVALSALAGGEGVFRPKEVQS